MADVHPLAVGIDTAKKFLKQCFMGKKVPMMHGSPGVKF